MHAVFFISLAAVGLFLGHANPFMHLPYAVLLTPLALVIVGREGTYRGAFLHGFIAGLAGYAGVLHWIAIPPHDFGMLPWMLAVPCPVLLSVFPAAFAGCFALAVRVVSSCRMPPWVEICLFGLAWYLLEWLRGFILTGFPWAPLSAAFAERPHLIAMVSVIGAYGLSGVLTSVMACCAYGPRQVLAGCAVLLGMVSFGAVWLAVDIPADGPASPIMIVQGNIDQHTKWDKAAIQATVRRYIDLTRAALDHRTGDIPALVVWPETAMPFDLERQSGLAETLRVFCQEYGVHLLTGALGYDRKCRKFLNRAYLISPKDRPMAWYEKEHLVPFGEYVPPFFNLPFLERLMQGVGAFTTGRRLSPLTVEGVFPSLVGGVLICYEGIFPELAAGRVSSGATLLVNISNDAWFGNTPAPLQHLHSVMLRAVEQGRPLVRATNTGISAFIDAHGRILVRTALLSEAVEERLIVPTNAGYRTIFSAVGPFLPGAAALMTLALWWYGCHHRRKYPCCNFPI